MPFGWDILFLRISIRKYLWHVQMRMTNAVLFVIVKIGKKTQMFSVQKLQCFKNRKITKLWYNQRKEYYSEIKLYP